MSEGPQLPPVDPRHRHSQYCRWCRRRLRAGEGIAAEALADDWHPGTRAAFCTKGCYDAYQRQTDLPGMQTATVDQGVRLGRKGRQAIRTAGTAAGKPAWVKITPQMAATMQMAFLGGPVTQGEQDISVLELPPRVEQLLRRRRVTRVHQLVTASDEQLFAYEGVGLQTVRAIRAALAAQGAPWPDMGQQLATEADRLRPKLDAALAEGNEEVQDAFVWLVTGVDQLLGHLGEQPEALGRAAIVALVLGIYHRPTKETP